MLLYDVIDVNGDTQKVEIGSNHAVCVYDSRAAFKIVAARLAARGAFKIVAASIEAKS